jgi:hypothetical protein
MMSLYIKKFSRIYRRHPPALSVDDNQKALRQIPKLPLDVLQPQAALELLRKLIGDERADLTPLPPSLQGKGESDSPLLAGEGLGERSIGEVLALANCVKGWDIYLWG